MKKLGQIIKEKIKIRLDSLVLAMTCVSCQEITDESELDYNSKFAMYDNKRICNKCADKLEEDYDTNN